MASYTDIIPQFTPYVSETPVQALVEVGMEKQRRYDEGIQKIQTYIDNIAGLDVANDADRAYLQSAINGLGSKLKTVAAGDFSNFQLVNTASGMANQIIKDPVIKNAVTSTAWYRKQSAEMEKAISEGKASQANISDFNEKASAWFNSKTPGQVFRDRYTPYIDVQKKWFEVLKSLHSDLREEDIPYERNNDGTIDYTKTAAAMQRVSKQVVSSAKIENALRASLTPDELNQLNIDAKYTLKAYDTPEKLSIYSTTRFNSQIERNEAKIKQLEGVANLSTSNPDLRKSALDTIEDLRNVNNSLRTQLNEELDYINSDMNAAKLSIYKNGAISQFANAFAWEENKSNLLSNPVLEAEHWERNFALDRTKLNLSIRAQNWNEFKDRFDMDIKTKEYDLKVQKQIAELYGTTMGPDGKPAFTTYLGQSTKVKDPLTAAELDVVDLNSSADTKVQAIAKDIKGATVGQVEQAIKDYNSGDPKRIANASKIIPVEWRDEVDQIINMRTEAKRLQAGISNVKNEVANSPEFIDRRRSLSESVKGLPSITIKDAAGNNVVFTPNEIAAYLGKIETKSSAAPGGVGVATSRPIATLSPKERLLYSASGNLQGGEEGLKQFGQQMKQAIGGLFGMSSPSTQVQSSVVNTLRRYNEKIQNASNKYEKDLNFAVSTKLLERTGTYVPMLETISFGSGEGNIARRTWEGIASNALAKYDEGYADQLAGGEEKMDSDDRDTAKSWLSGEKKDNIIYKKLTQGNKTYLVLINNGEEVFVPLSQDETSQLPRTSNTTSPFYKQIVDAQYYLNGKTNPTGKYEDAMFNRSSIPNVTLDVKADLDWNKSNTEKQYITLMLNTPAGVYPLKLDNYPMDRTRAIGFIQGLTNEKVKQLYLQDPSIPQEWKSVVSSLK